MFFYHNFTKGLMDQLNTLKTNVPKLVIALLLTQMLVLISTLGYSSSSVEKDYSPLTNQDVEFLI